MQRRIRLLALASIALGFLPSLWSQTSSDTALPMPEDYFPGLKSLLETAVKQSPRMLARNTEEAVAESNRIVYRSGQLPSASGYFTYYPWDRQTRDYGTGSAPVNVTKIGYGLSLSQPVFHWGAVQANTRIGALQLKIAKGQTGEAYRALAYEIRASYLQLIMRKAGLARARFSQKIADDNLALARSKREKNVISDADLFGPTISAEQARLTTDRTFDDYENYKVLFAKLTGGEPLTDDLIPNAIPPVSPASSAAPSLANEFASRSELDTYSLETLRKQIDVERLNYKIASTRLLPRLTFVAGVSQDQQKLSVTGGIPYMVRDYYAGGSVSWSMFDGFATRAAKRASLARQRQMERTYKDQTDDVIRTVRTQTRQIDYAARSLAIVEKQLESSHNILVAAQEDLKRGNVSEAGVNSIQLNYQDMEIGAFNARYDYMMKVVDFLSTIMKDPALQNLPAQYR